MPTPPTLATLEPTPVACTGCGDVVAEFNQAGFAGLLTDHDEACDWHSRESRCRHQGPCYAKVPNLEKAVTTDKEAVVAEFDHIWPFRNGIHHDPCVRCGAAYGPSAGRCRVVVSLPVSGVSNDPTDDVLEAGRPFLQPDTKVSLAVDLMLALTLHRLGISEAEFVAHLANHTNGSST